MVVRFFLRVLSMAEVENSRSERQQDSVKQKKWARHKDNDHVVRKRLPHKPPKRPNDIYVTNRSNFQVFVVFFFLSQ